MTRLACVFALLLAAPSALHAQLRVTDETFTRAFSCGAVACPAAGFYSGYVGTLRGELEAPFTFRGLVADMDMQLADWINAPQLIDGANMSSITSLRRIPRLWQGLEIGIFQEQDTPTCTYDDGSGVGCAGDTLGVRGASITIGNFRPPWETPRGAARYTGLEINGLRSGRMLGAAISIDGSWAQHVWIMNSRGETIFLVEDDGTVLIRDRQGRLVPINP